VIFSWPIDNPTVSVTVRDPDYRDQVTDHVGTTLKRMEDGKVIPFNQLEVQKTVSMTFSNIGYKRMKKFMKFLIDTNGQPIRVEGIAGFTEDSGQTCTVITDPFSIITQNRQHKQLNITLSLQQSIVLQGKHQERPDGNASGVPYRHNSFYLIGGNDGLALLGYNTEYARFLGEDGVWTERVPILAPDREHHCGFTDETDGSLYVTGGTNGSSKQTRANKYTPIFASGGTWFTLSSSLNIARTDAEGFYFDGKGWVTGGRNVTNVIDSIENYEFESWSQNILSLPYARADHASFVAVVQDLGSGSGSSGVELELPDEQPFIIGGVNSVGTVLDSTIVLRNGAWVEVMPLNNPAKSLRGGYSQSNDQGYVFGGEDSGLTDNVETYIPSADTWAVLATLLPNVISEHSGASLVEAIYSIGGRDGSTIYDTNWEYTEANAIWVARQPITTTGNLNSPRYNSIALSSWAGGSPIPEAQLPGNTEDTPIGDYVVVTGGNSFTDTGSDAKKGYTLNNNTWTWDYGSYVTENNLPKALALHQQGVVNKEVFVLDGATSRDYPEFGVYKFDVAKTWSTLLDLIQPVGVGSRNVRYLGNAEVYQGDIYTVNGAKEPPISFRSINGSIDVFNPSAGWSKEITFQTPLYFYTGHVNAASALYQDLILLIAGFVRNENGISTALVRTNKVTGYNITTKALKIMTPMLALGGPQTLKSGLSALNINNDIYSFSGAYTNLLIDKRTLKYDPLLDVWTDQAPGTDQAVAPQNYGCANTSIDTNGMTCGGEDGDGGKFGNTMIYDTLTNAWGTSAVTPISLSECRASLTNKITDVVAGADVVLVGGNSHTSRNVASNCYRHNVINNVYTKIPTLSFLHSFACETLNDLVYAIGVNLFDSTYDVAGYNNSRTVNVYDPGTGSIATGFEFNWDTQTTNYTKIPNGVPYNEMAHAAYNNEMYLYAGVTGNANRSQPFVNYGVLDPADRQIFKYDPLGLAGVTKGAFIQSQDQLTGGGLQKKATNNQDKNYIIGGHAFFTIFKSGGRIGSNIINSHNKHDLGFDSVTVLENTPAPLTDGCYASMADGDNYYVSGSYDSSVWKYDVSGDSYSNERDFKRFFSGTGRARGNFFHLYPGLNESTPPFGDSSVYTTRPNPTRETYIFSLVGNFISHSGFVPDGDAGLGIRRNSTLV
jgi:hypothetical protein